MEREKAVYLSQVKAAKSQEARDALNFQPDFSGQEYLLERLLKPEARRDVVESLRQAGIRPTAMIDVSDGISSELLHICHESQVGCRIFEERLPIDYQTAVAAEQFNLNVSTCALNGGEDYELLFTVPLTDHERVEALPDVKIIVTSPLLPKAHNSSRAMATNLPSKPKVGTLQKPSPSFHTYPQKEVLQNSFCSISFSSF